ncbi:MAG: phosphoribosylglycinamide formyltransferase [Chromatiales bacterium]|nr:phosphoribosylglycinamide formyltransferase [Chromatiales bacterium]
MNGTRAQIRTVILISGSGTNLQAIINEVRSGELEINLCAVISDRPGIQGLERAEQAGIPTRVVDYQKFEQRADADTALGRELESTAPDLVILAGFMRILPAEIVTRYRGHMLNIHPSLLPKYRGLHTYRRAIEAGDSHHGSTVHFVTAELDAGPAIVQYRVPINANETEASLAARVQQGEYLIYPRAICWFAEGRLRLYDGDVWLDNHRQTQPAILNEL